MPHKLTKGKTVALKLQNSRKTNFSHLNLQTISFRIYKVILPNVIFPNITIHIHSFQLTFFYNFNEELSKNKII